jgi:hypothetical protein
MTSETAIVSVPEKMLSMAEAQNAQTACQPKKKHEAARAMTAGPIRPEGPDGPPTEPVVRPLLLTCATASSEKRAAPDQY